MMMMMMIMMNHSCLYSPAAEQLAEALWLVLISTSGPASTGMGHRLRIRRFL